MKNLIAAAVLFLYAVSSAGVVLVEYSCHETGTSGLTTPAPRACYAPTCEEDIPAEAADPCCDHDCCEIDVRVSAPDEQIAGATPDFDAADTGDGSAGAGPVAFEHVAAAPGDCLTTLTSSGFDRPLRI